MSTHQNLDAILTMAAEYIKKIDSRSSLDLADKFFFENQHQIKNILSINDTNYINVFNELFALAVDLNSARGCGFLLDYHFESESKIENFEKKSNMEKNFYHIMIKNFFALVESDSTELALLVFKKCKNIFYKNAKDPKLTIVDIFSNKINKGCKDGGSLLKFLTVYNDFKNLDLDVSNNYLIDEYFISFFKEAMVNEDLDYLVLALTFKNQMEKIDLYNERGEHVLHIVNENQEKLKYVAQHLINQKFKSLAELFEIKAIDSKILNHALALNQSAYSYEHIIKETLKTIQNETFPIEYRKDLYDCLENNIIYMQDLQYDFFSLVKQPVDNFISLYNENIFDRLAGLIVRYANSNLDELKNEFNFLLSRSSYFVQSKAYRNHYSFELILQCIENEVHDLLAVMLNTECRLFNDETVLLDFAAFSKNVPVYSALLSKINANPEKYPYLHAKHVDVFFYLENIFIDLKRKNISEDSAKKTLNFAKFLLSQHKEYCINAPILVGDSVGNVIFLKKDGFPEDWYTDIVEHLKNLGIPADIDFNVSRLMFGRLVKFLIHKRDHGTLVKALGHSSQVQALCLYSLDGETVYETCEKSRDLNKVAQRLINGDFLTLIQFSKQSKRNLNIIQDCMRYTDVNEKAYQWCLEALIEAIDCNEITSNINLDEFGVMFPHFVESATKIKDMQNLVWALGFDRLVKKLKYYSFDDEILYEACKNKNDLTNVANRLINKEFYSIFDLMDSKELSSKVIADFIEDIDLDEKEHQWFFAEIISIIIDESKPLKYREYLLEIMHEQCLVKVILTGSVQRNILEKLEMIKRRSVGSIEILINIFPFLRNEFLIHFMQSAPNIIFSRIEEDKDKLYLETDSLLSPVESGISVIYNNDYYLGSNIEFASDSRISFIKGDELLWRKEPIGYSAALPENQISHVFIEVYAGGTEAFTPEDFLVKEYQYLLNNGIAVIFLNLPDLKELKTHQGKMTNDLHEKIHGCIEHARNIFKYNPENLHLSLLPIKGAFMFLYGASFGGRTAIRHAELYPDSFDGFISHDGSISADTIAQTDLGSRTMLGYLDPAKIDEMRKIEKPILLMHNMDDNNINVKVTLDFYHKMVDIGKDNLLKLHITTSGSKRADRLSNKGHYAPEGDEFVNYMQTIVNFIINGPSLLPSLNRFRAFKRNIQANQYYNPSTILEQFVSEGMETYRLKKKKESVAEAWESDYLPIFVRMFYVGEIMHSPVALKKEIDRLFKDNLLSDSMILAALKSLINPFVQYANIQIENIFSLEACNDPLLLSLDNRSLISDFKRNLLLLDSQKPEYIKFILSNLYKTNPTLLEPIVEDVSKVSQSEQKVAKEMLQNMIYQKRTLISNLFMEAAKKEKARLNTSIEESESLSSKKITLKK